MYIVWTENDGGYANNYLQYPKEFHARVDGVDFSSQYLCSVCNNCSYFTEGKLNLPKPTQQVAV